MESRRTLTLGSRASRLALRQTHYVLEQLRNLHPQREFQVVTVTTHGDTTHDAPMTDLGIGAFVKELQTALLERRVDLAVHSLKDLPTAPTPGLIIAAIPPREDARDVLVNRWGCSLEDLPSGARIGSSSPRRSAQVLAARPDLRMLPIRGNVDTRLMKARGPNYDGVVVAAAALLRLGLEVEASQPLPFDICLPAPGQGALAVEVREGDEELVSLVTPLDHWPSRVAVEAERAFLNALGGGCRVPVAALGHLGNQTLRLRGIIATEDGKEAYRDEETGNPKNAPELGVLLYKKLMSQGAGRLLGVKEQAR